jgi:hypothetical protein
VITSEQLVPSAVAQRIVVTFVISKNVKPVKILKRLRAQFGDEKLSRTQAHDRSKSFQEGRTEVENMRRLHLLQGNMSREFWDFQGILFINFLTE